MRLLFDTHILIILARHELDRLSGSMALAVTSTENVAFASAASLWEIAIKTRLGKIEPGLPLEELPDYLQEIGLYLLVVNHRHAVRSLDPEPATRDPFDRLLLAQCAVEQLRLVTIDRVLSRHPLAWADANR
ncbi:MAG TPA: type II toxin-antitoxin system VapC family toxin [Xanthobacteraceae bacterium]|jgi:PIN domain nuclease of toxin-antitoxin system|nr:type II toxin-antitoxin system VapC family toxin [Xanthobacteraceae bacterium]